MPLDAEININKGVKLWPTKLMMLALLAEPVSRYGEAIEGDPIYVIDAAKCTDCGACAEACPAEAISAE